MDENKACWEKMPGDSLQRWRWQAAAAPQAHVAEAAVGSAQTRFARIDVVVPCYNYAHLLRECVESVLSQVGVDVRVLILDDASPDDTHAVGTDLSYRDKRVIYRRHKVNLGHIATYNEGIDWAEGDLFLLLSADDYLLPGALGRSAQLMLDQPNVGFTFGNAIIAKPDGTTQRFDPAGTSSVKDFRVYSGAEFIRLSGATNIVPTPTAVTRTELQKYVGGYRRELPHAGDMEMWFRLASHANVGFINRDHAVYRRHETNMSLKYCVDDILPDLRQRKKAIELLFQHATSGIRDDETLRRFLAKELGREAIGQASAAFNKFDIAAAAAIQRFASEVYPEGRNSLPWIKLALKQLVGPRWWNVFNSTYRRSVE